MFPSVVDHRKIFSLTFLLFFTLAQQEKLFAATFCHKCDFIKFHSFHFFFRLPSIRHRCVSFFSHLHCFILISSSHTLYFSPLWMIFVCVVAGTAVICCTKGNKKKKWVTVSNYSCKRSKSIFHRKEEWESWTVFFWRKLRWFDAEKRAFGLKENYTHTKCKRKIKLQTKESVNRKMLNHLWKKKLNWSF